MSTILEVVIGLGFVYLLFSAITSSLVEWVSAVFDRRSKSLHKSLDEILGPALRKQLLAHPAIAGIQFDPESGDKDPQQWRWFFQAWPTRTPPNHLSPRSVAIALADLARQPSLPKRKALDQRLKRLFQSFNAGADAEVLFRLEKWFDEQMRRTSSQYKRWTQVLTLFVAIVLTGAFDIDSVRIASELYRNPTVRASIADQAARQTEGKTAQEIKTSLQDTVLLPIGWNSDRSTSFQWLSAVAGWLISVIALGLGAPFWFDLVGRIVNLRQTGARPQPAQFTAQ